MKTAIVKLWGEMVGAVAWNENQNIATYEFEDNFLKRGLDLSPILMPIANSKGKIYQFNENKGFESTFKGLPGLLADILPDKYGNALIQSWLASQGRNSTNLNPLEVLSFIGKRGMGALEIEPSLRVEENKASKIEMESIVNLANQILNNRVDFSTNLSTNETSALADILKIGTSAGGARAKAIIAFNETTGEVRSGQIKAPLGFEHWLIKFDGVSDSQFGASSGYGKVEMAYHLMAKSAGIEMTECRLLEENGRSHFMTKRFDRTLNGDKIHSQSFCAMRHFDFNMIGYYGYEQLFETMRMLGCNYQEAEQVFRRMVFNVLSKNCDDHTKNFAFLMDKTGKWSISPAYFLCDAYRPYSPWVSNQSFTINGKREQISTEDFMQVAERMNIKKAKFIIEEITLIVSKWRDFADEVNVNTDLRDAIFETF